MKQVLVGIVTAVAIGGLVLVLLGGIFLFRSGGRLPTPPTPPPTPVPPPPRAPVDVSALTPKVTAFCGDCHAPPRPQSFPREAWLHEVERGYNFYYDSGRHDLQPPPLNDVVAFYREQAPERLEIPAPLSDRMPTRFHANPLATKEDLQAISFTRTAAWTAPDAVEFLSTDMKTGRVSLWSRSGDAWASRTLESTSHPAHVEPVDLDIDGHVDLIVADLGSALPEDHGRGRVVWLKRAANGDGLELIVLQDQLGRVADVQPGDFDADGDIDLVVAEFGWLKTGRILLLENTAARGQPPTFEQRVIDPRHGTIHVPTIDLNGDGRLDFVALISQEHEAIVAFLNERDLKFRPETIYAANDPSYGSSGIQLVDLDRDGDTDVVYSNGDTLDSFYVKPYHGVQWLENPGGFPFKHHPLGAMPGVARAVAGDLDGDGDLDVAAAAYLPRNLLNQFDVKELDSLRWWENLGGDKWQAHSLERGVFTNMALEIADHNGDQRPDLLVGHFKDPKTPKAAPVTLWRNAP